MDIIGYEFFKDLEKDQTNLKLIEIFVWLLDNACQKIASLRSFCTSRKFSTFWDIFPPAPRGLSVAKSQIFFLLLLLLIQGTSIGLDRTNH